MIDVSNGTDVAMRLISLKYLFFRIISSQHNTEGSDARQANSVSEMCVLALF